MGSGGKAFARTAGWRLLSSCGILLATQTSLWANDIFEYQGPQTRAYGGAGVIMGSGGESVLANPANLMARAQSDLYVDLSLLRLDYKITNPDPTIKPSRIVLPVLPLPSLGGSWHKSKWSLGFMFLPTGIGSKNKVKDFNLEMDGVNQTVDIDASQKGFKVGLGLAHQLTSQFSLGISVIYDQFATESTIKLTQTDAIATRTDAKFWRPVVGLRYLWSSLGTLAMSYQFKKEYAYALEVDAFAEETQKFERHNYRPTVYSLGALTRSMRSISFFGQYSYEVWVPATFTAQSPNQALAGDTDVEFLNTHNYILGLRYRSARASHVAFSFSKFGKNKGPGLLSESGKVLLSGRGPQDFESLDRYHLTLSHGKTSKSSTWTGYGSFIRATALNPENTPNAGFYEMTIYLAGVSYARH